MPNIDEEIAAEVRAALARRSVRDAELAGWLGISRSTANRKKMGRASFTLVELRTLGQRLDQDWRAWLPGTSVVPSTSAYALTGGRR